MPSKAAQVLGTAPRDLHKIETRPAKIPELFDASAKLTRSDTSKSLPEKIGNAQEHARYHGQSLSRRSRTAHKSANRGTKNFSDMENKPRNRPHMPRISIVSELESPPTPPAKDTPRKTKPALMPSSPLRRTRHSEHLRETYGANLDLSVKLCNPKSALSPLPFGMPTPKKYDMSQVRFHAYGHEESTQKIEDSLQWPYSDASGTRAQHDDIYPITPGTKNQEPPMVSQGPGSNEIHNENHYRHHLNFPPLDFSACLDRATLSPRGGKSGSQEVSDCPFFPVTM